MTDSHLDIISVDEGRAVIEVDITAVRMWKAAIRETREALSEHEFQTRTAYTEAEMQGMWEQLDELSHRIKETHVST